MGGGVHVERYGGLVAVVHGLNVPEGVVVGCILLHRVVCRMVLLLKELCVGQRHRRHMEGRMSVVGMNCRGLCRRHRRCRRRRHGRRHRDRHRHRHRSVCGCR